MPPHSRLAARYVDRRPTLDHAAQTVRGNLSVPASGVTPRKDVFLLQSLNQNYNPRRLERYLALALQSGVRKNDYLEANSYEYQHET